MNIDDRYFLTILTVSLVELDLLSVDEAVAVLRSNPERLASAQADLRARLETLATEDPAATVVCRVFDFATAPEPEAFDALARAICRCAGLVDVNDLSPDVKA